MRFALVATGENETNVRLARAGGAGWTLATPDEAVRWLVPGTSRSAAWTSVPGWTGSTAASARSASFEARGVRVLNPASALIAAHDKLVTARLSRERAPHRTWCVTDGSRRPVLVGPIVVKPRFGSWGRDVVRCADDEALARELERVARFPWFAAHGARAGARPAARVRPADPDRRGRVVGAIRRLAAPGEWRTNIALGARREALHPPPDACELALACATVAGTDIAGIDLLPVEGGWVVLELNGAVDFTSEYSSSEDVFTAATRELARTATASDPVVPVLSGG
jgi:hypothetical protein